MWHHKFGYGEREELKKMKKFIDHVLLLFNFEKRYFEKEQLSCEFVGHPLLDQKQKVKLISIK